MRYTRHKPGSAGLAPFAAMFLRGKTAAEVLASCRERKLLAEPEDSPPDKRREPKPAAGARGLFEEGRKV